MKGRILVSPKVRTALGPQIASAAPGVTLEVLGESTPAALKDVEVAYYSADIFPAKVREFVLALMKTRELRWLHSFGIGVDSVLFESLRKRGVIITRSRGASETDVAHTALLQILALSRDLRAWHASQLQRDWAPHLFTGLEGQRLGVLGMGPIGCEIARLGAAFRMKVTGMRRTVTGTEPCETWSFARLPELLSSADFLVLALPLTPETFHLMDERNLGLMRRDSRIINIGRGALIDEAALLRALKTHHLAGAALDVFEVEPLPRDSELWALPQVLLTPHSAGATAAAERQATTIFLENLRRYCTDPGILDTL